MTIASIGLRILLMDGTGFIQACTVFMSINQISMIRDYKPWFTMDRMKRLNFGGMAHNAVFDWVFFPKGHRLSGERSQQRRFLQFSYFCLLDSIPLLWELLGIFRHQLQSTFWV